MKLTEGHPIHITSDSELGHFLDAGGKPPVLLEKDGKLYRLIEESTDTQEEEYDPEKVKAAVLKTTGTWSDIDPDQFIADLYRAREEGSRPISRP